MLVRETGLKYMMAETVLYSREYFVRQGAVCVGTARSHPVPAGQPSSGHGRLARRMAGAAADVLRDALHFALPGARFRRGGIRLLFRLGSNRGGFDPALRLAFCGRDPPTFALRGSDVCVRVYRALFDTARQYRESFDVFGSKMSIEWPLVEGEGLVLHTAKQPQAETTRRVIAPDYARPPSRADPSLHHQNLPRSAGICASRASARRRSGRDPCPSRRRSRLARGPWRLPPSSRPRIRLRADRGPGSVPRRGSVGEHHLCRPPGARVSNQRWREDSPPRLCIPQGCS